MAPVNCGGQFLITGAWHLFTQHVGWWELVVPAWCWCPWVRGEQWAGGEALGEIYHPRGMWQCLEMALLLYSSVPQEPGYHDIPVTPPRSRDVRSQQAGASPVPHPPGKATSITTRAVTSLQGCSRGTGSCWGPQGLALMLSVLRRLVRREHSDPIVEELNPGDALEPEGRGTGESPQSWQGQPMPGVCHSTAWHPPCLGMLHA